MGRMSDLAIDLARAEAELRDFPRFKAALAEWFHGAAGRFHSLHVRAYEGDDGPRVQFILTVGRDMVGVELLADLEHRPELPMAGFLALTLDRTLESLACAGAAR